MTVKKLEGSLLYRDSQATDAALKSAHNFDIGDFLFYEI